MSLTKGAISLMKTQGPKYRGIYQKTTEAGTRFIVQVSVMHPDGKRQFVRRTCAGLAEALRVREKLVARKTLQALPKRRTDKVTIGHMCNTLRNIKRTGKNWENNRLYLNEIEAYFGPSRPLADIDEGHINGFRDFLDRQPKRGGKSGFLSNRSKDHRLQELRNLFNIAIEKGHLERAPRIRLFYGYGRRHYTLNLEAFGQLLAHMPGPPKPHRAILLMGLYTGQRASDLLRMRREQVDESISFRSSKTGGLFRIRTPEAVAAALGELPTVGEWLFPNPKTREPYYDLRKPLTTASRSAGIDRVTLHMIRHLAADEIAMITGNAMFVQKYIGWYSQSMVDNYTHVNQWSTPLVEALDKRVGRILGSVTAFAGSELYDGPPSEAVAAELATSSLSMIHEELDTRLRPFLAPVHGEA